MDKDRKNKTVVLLHQELYQSGIAFPDGEPDSLADFLKGLKELINTVPTEFRDSLTLEFGAEHSYEDFIERFIKITYVRPETDAEQFERTEKDRVIAERQEEKERQTYLALKAKFEKKES